MKKIIDNTFNFTYKFILIFTFSCLSIALIGATFFYVNRSYDYLNPLVLIVGTILYLSIIIKLYKYITKLSENKIKYISICLLLIQFILLFISTKLIRSIPQVDLIHILTGINSLDNMGILINSEYFSVYPNNRFLLMLLYGINKISQNKDVITYLFSSICITTMSFFTYKTVEKIGDSKKALLSLFICVFSPIFYLYVSYYYTDVIMLPFASILMYLIVKNESYQNPKIKFLNNLLIGIIAIIGYKIRAVSIFLLIAYFVYLISKKQFAVLFKNSIPILIGLLITGCFINSIENKMFNNLDKSKEFPLTHWIMMGVNYEKNGFYSQDDYNLSFNAKNINDRKELNIKKIYERIKKQGIIDNVKLTVTKIVQVWGRGDYSYQKYLDLAQDYNKSYNYLIEDKNIIINYILQICNMSVLILSIVSLIIFYKKRKTPVIAIAVFGAILFYLIWEVCPRYGLSFLPWLIILSTYSYESIDVVYNKINSNNIIKYIVLFITILLLGIGFYNYTSFSNKKSIVAKDTSKKIQYVELNSQNKIKQEVSLNGKFNEIRLKFDTKNNGNDKNIYTLELQDSSGNVEFKKEFNSSNIISNKYTVFKLNKNYEKGKYYIKLTTNSNIPLYVALSYKEQFDFYPPGIFTINDEKQDGDVMFEVINNENRGTYTRGGFIVLIIVILSIEYILFFRKREEKIESK